MIFLQQIGTFALTLIITCLSSLYDDESIQIGMKKRLDLNFMKNLFLDSPKNCNYVSIFTRKLTIKKKNLSIIQNSENWKMLKIEVKLPE